MKHNLFLLAVTLVLWIFFPALASAQTYDVDYKAQPVESVIKDLRAKTGYQFVYKKETVSQVSPITCKYSNATLQQLLNRIFYEEAGIDYEVSRGTVILKKMEGDKPYFKKLVIGVVTDSEGYPLAGATVRVVETSVGVATDLEGVFSVTVEGKTPHLEVSYVGMKSRTVKVNPRAEGSLMIQLELDNNLLSEVLVTGYQNIKRENATGAYQMIGASNLDERYSKELMQRLEGQVPGLSVYNNGKGTDITIRGVGSFQAKTSPLIVVDGLPIEGSLESVNTYDIANITVLKDASAAAIYGARASNGVIVITTKRANSEKIAVDFNADLTISGRQSFDNCRWASAEQLLELEQYNFDYVTSHAELYNTLLGQYASNPHSLSSAARLLLQRRLGTVSSEEFERMWNYWKGNDYVKDWRDAMLRTQIQHQYNLSLRTKGKKLNSNIVLNYQGDNLGIQRENEHTLRASYVGDLEATKWLSLTLGLSLVNDRSKQHISDEYNNVTSFLPYQSMRNADGSLSDMEAAVWLGEATLANPSLGLKSESFNLLNEVKRNFTNARRNNLRSFIHADVTLLPELTLSAKFQYEDISYKSESYYEADSYYMRHRYNLFTSGGTHYLPDGGMLKSVHQHGDYYTFRTQANYSRTFADRHAVEAIAGFEYRQTHHRYLNQLLLGYDDQTQTNMNHLVNFNDLMLLESSDMGPYYSPIGSAPTEDDFKTEDVKHRFYSLYANASYTYDTRYSLSFSYRVDKADLFGADPKFRGRPLWSVGASWNIGNEKFMEEYDWIDALKLRTSYGLTGNIDQSVSSYLTAAISVNDMTGQKAAQLNTPPNDQLRWEKTSSLNVGVDFSFFNNRLSGSLDAYAKWGSDLLALTDIDPTTGWTSLTINNGKATNKGVELQLNGEIIKPSSPRQLGVNASFNIAYNQNKVTRVDHLPTSGYEALYVMHEGRPVNALYSYRFAGMQTDESGTQAYGWIDAKGNVHATSILSGEFSVDDILFSGGLDPKVVASFTPEVTWKGFSLSALFTYYGGHYMRAAMEDWGHGGSYLGYGGPLGNMDEQVPAAYLDYWKSSDKQTAIGNGAMGYNTIGTPEYIDRTVVKADFLKLRSLMLGYQFNKRFCRRLGVEGLRLRVQMNNVAKWVANDLDIDPEAVDPISGYATNKPKKSYTMSLSINL